MFLEPQISILQWRLKDHVTLKTGVMMLKMQLCITGKKLILKYTHTKKTVVLNCNTISQYYCVYCIFEHINVVLMSKRNIYTTLHITSCFHTWSPEFKHACCVPLNCHWWVCTSESMSVNQPQQLNNGHLNNRANSILKNLRNHITTPGKPSTRQ